jgi:hypothetical protein
MSVGGRSGVEIDAVMVMSAKGSEGWSR